MEYQLSEGQKDKHLDFMQKNVKQYVYNLYHRVTTTCVNQLFPSTSNNKEKILVKQQDKQQCGPMQQLSNGHGEQSHIYPTTINKYKESDKKSIINLTYQDEPSSKTHHYKGSKENKKKLVPIKFKKHQKLFTQRNKEVQDQLFFQNNRLSTQARNHQYDPVYDQSLVQYFYPKKGRILKEQPFSPRKNSHQRSNRKVLKASKSQKHFKQGHKFKINPGKPYEVSNECGRNASFNEYDLISCQVSLSPSSKLKNKSINTLKSQRFPMKQKIKKQQLSNFKKRMVNLQLKILQKVPYLMKMGVMFKKPNKK